MKISLKTKRKLIRLLIYPTVAVLPIVLTLAICVAGYIKLEKHINAEEKAFDNAKEALTQYTVSRKFADYDHNEFYICYDLSYLVTYDNGKTEPHTTEMYVKVTSNKFDDIRTGDIIYVSDIPDKGQDKHQLRQER